VEINVTRLFRDHHPRDFSASMAELGPSAGRDTWRAALELAAELREARRPFLRTAAQIDALRDDMRDTGAWSRAEVDSWSPDKCNAMLIQSVAGRMREAGFPPLPSSAEWRAFWNAEAARQERGEGGRFWKDRRGRVWFYLGT